MINPFRKSAEDGSKLVQAIDYLCGNVVALAQTVVALNEQLKLLHHTMQRIDGRLDRAECWAHEQLGYPRSQTEIPNYADIRRDIETARKGG